MGRPRYRQGVCVVLRRPGTQRVLVCHRRAGSAAEGWQFPQGGVDPALDPLDEARRELREEIGTDAIEPRAVCSRLYRYEIPPQLRRPGSPYAGQSHRWILADLLAPDSAIRFVHQPAEFDGFEWVSPQEALARVVAFKREAYRAALGELGLLPPSCGRGGNVHNNPAVST